MLTGILGLVGTALGLLPAILQFFTVKANNAQALALKQLELQAATQGYSFQLQLEDAKADTAQQEHVYSFAAAPSGIKWVDALAVFVRPYITLIIFHVYLGGEAFLILYAIANGVSFVDIVNTSFDESFKGLVAMIVGFWFGNRGGSKAVATALAITQPNVGKIVPQPATQAPRPSPGFIPAPPGDRP